MTANPSTRLERGTTGRSDTARAIVAALVLSGAVLGLALLGFAFTAGILAGVGALAYIFRRRIFTVDTLLVVLLFVLLLIPLSRYSLRMSPAITPLMAMVLISTAIVTLRLLFDRSFSWRPTPLGWAVSGFIAAQFVSIVVNIRPLLEAGFVNNSIREVSYYVSFIFLLFFTVRQALRSPRTVRLVLGVLVATGGVVGALAMLERAIAINVFFRLGSFLPLRATSDEFSLILRDGATRSTGSASNPIELGVMLALILPFAFFLASESRWPRPRILRRLVWFGAAAFMLGGIFASVSRTAIVMVVILVVVSCLLRPRLIPVIGGSTAALGVALFTFAPSVFSGTLGTLLDPQALVQSQKTSPGFRGSGRLTDLPASIDRILEDPWFGTGIGSRFVSGDFQNALILDNQLLTTGEAAGLVGVAGIVLLFAVPLWRLGCFIFAGTSSPASRSLAVTLAVAFASYAFALVVLDAFAFWQAVGVFVVLLAIASWLLSEVPWQPRRSVTAGSHRASAQTVHA
ncbi:O-antigen ligase family protein [Planctomonas psychrotolerans]|uniref:O-antigen ligase family protein n=1 Tax=Planctomonas psychrotolerans TaxID=2528712 RepID=UPI00123964AD|nr:O-antigen ligase family protein [Planctomonas psychrotolerans]